MNYTIQDRPQSPITILDITTPQASLSLSLFGGHILRFQPTDQSPLLWLSDNAVLDGTKAIRGGIPICWPWFGAHPSDPSQPAHGLVREQNWCLQDSHYHNQILTLLLSPEKPLPDGLSVELEVVISHELTVTLISHNHSKVPQPLSCALHNYFTVENINETQILGLDKTLHWNKLVDNQAQTTPCPYVIDNETDNVHITQCSQVSIKNKEHIIQVQSSGHDSFVVWNPWEEKSRFMSDMSASGFETMLCVETAITQGFILAPEQRHRLTQKISS